MKKFLVLIIFALTINSLSAQQFGIKGGLNLAKIKGSTDGYSVGFDNITSFHLGIIYDTPISNNFYFNTGAIFTQKGFKFDYTDQISGTTLNLSMRINYIQIPINFALKHETGNVKLFAQAGPFVSMGVTAKGEGAFSFLGTTDTSDGKIEFGSGDDQIKRLDYGLSIGAGIEFNKIQLGIGYDIGMANIFNDSDVKITTRNLQFSVCYFF